MPVPAPISATRQEGIEAEGRVRPIEELGRIARTGEHVILDPVGEALGWVKRVISLCRGVRPAMLFSTARKSTLAGLWVPFMGPAGS